MRVARTESVQTYARITGVVFLMALIAAGLGEIYVPAVLVDTNNAATTASNVVHNDLLFRLGWVGYMVEAVTDVTLTFLLYVLLRPVHANQAFLAVLFRLMATATYAFAELFYFAPSLILGGDKYLSMFSPDQLHSLTQLSFNIYNAGGHLFNVHYGIGSIILGSLMFRSGYLPRAVGAIWVLGGAGMVASSLIWIFAPAAATPFLVPEVIALLVLTVWLLVRGVDVSKWNERGALTMQAA
jgi:hypothetical protein